MPQHLMTELQYARTSIRALVRRGGQTVYSLAILVLLLTGALAVAGTISIAGSTGVFAQAQRTGPSGLPLPRFVSLKSDRVNVRRGPGQDYDVAFVFVRSGVPVEIIQEFDNWRKIRDWEGAEGWVFHSLLTGRRTAIIAPWNEQGVVSVRKLADGGGDAVAYLKPRVVAAVQQCNGSWCLIEGDRFGGWIEQSRLWGVYPEESIRP